MDGDVYLIYDAEDLAAFRDLVNGTTTKLHSRLPTRS